MNGSNIRTAAIIMHDYYSRHKNLDGFKIIYDATDLFHQDNEDKFADLIDKYDGESSPFKFSNHWNGFHEKIQIIISKANNFNGF